MVCSISLFNIVNVVIPEPRFFYEFAPDATAVNPNYIKTLLASDWNVFFINGKKSFIKGPRNLPRNSPDCIILDIWVFDNFILADN